MRVLLMWKVANEMSVLENDIKNCTGPYRPRLQSVQVDTVLGMPIYKKEWVAPVACWPFDDEYKSDFIQEKGVKEGFEGEVDDVCFAKIVDDIISYKVSDFKFSNPIKMDEWTMIILDPKGDFRNPVFFNTESNLNSLMEDLKEYRIGLQNVYPDDMNLEMVKGVLDKEFNKMMGVATFFLLHEGKLVHTGKWMTRAYDYIRGNS